MIFSYFILAYFFKKIIVSFFTDILMCGYFMCLFSSFHSIEAVWFTKLYNGAKKERETKREKEKREREQKAVISGFIHVCNTQTIVNSTNTKLSLLL